MLRILLARHKALHPGDAAAQVMKRLFERQGFARCEVAELEEALAKSLSKYHVVVLFCATQKLTAAAERNLCTFVQKGGGLVGLHAASDCSSKNKRFLDLLGAEFVKHDPHVPEWHVHIADRSHPLARDLEDFRITDEFYRVRLRDPKARVFLTFPRRGRECPLGLTRAQGKGRVCYLALGHGASAYRHPGFHRLLMRAVVYAAGRCPEAIQPIGVGFLGMRIGGMNEYHVRYARKAAGLVPVAACDVNPQSRRYAVETLGLKAYARPADMLEDDAVQLVAVNVPPGLHFREALRAIEAGRHVSVEKPFTLRLRDADRLIEAAGQRGVNLTCFQNRRWDPHYLAAQRIIRDLDGIGDPLEIRLDMGGYMPPHPSWRSDKRLSGGHFYAMGAHGVDWILNLMQQPGPYRADPGPVVGVSGHCLNWQWRMASNETHGGMVLRFAGGQVAVYCESNLHAGRHPESLEILGSEGAITFPNLFDEVAQWTRVVDGKQVHAEWPCPGDEWAYANFYRDLSDRLLLSLPQAVTAQSAARVVGIIEAAYRSARKGRELPFDDRYYGDT